MPGGGLQGGPLFEHFSLSLLCWFHCVISNCAWRPNWSQELPPWTTLTAALIKLKDDPLGEIYADVCLKHGCPPGKSTFWFVFCFAWHLLNWAALILLLMQSGPLSSRRSEGGGRGMLLINWLSGIWGWLFDWQGLPYLKWSVNTSKSSCWLFFFVFFL